MIILVSVSIITVLSVARVVILYRTGNPILWEREIRKFEKEDHSNFPETGKILFTGSSSIRFWNTLNQDMVPLKVLNRGFGGSQIHQVTYYADRIIFPYEPRGIVFYAGENDSGPKTPDEIFENFKLFVEKIQVELQEIPIYFISIKPPKRRIKLWSQMQEANSLIKKFCSTKHNLFYIDIVPAMLDPECNPRADVFKWDGIHLNAEGYKIWTSVVKPILIDTYSSN